MRRTIIIKRITLGSLFQIIFLGLASWLVPLMIIFGIAGAFGSDVIKMNNIYVHGWQALFSGFIGAPIAVFFFSTFFTLLIFPGLWIHSYIRSFSIDFIEPTKTEQDAAANP